MRALPLALVLVSTAAFAQPTADKPPETTPTGTANVKTIKVTTKKFGPVKFGKKLTLASVKKAFPKATIKSVKGKTPSWNITGDNDLLAHAEVDRIIVARGPVEVHGVMIGDDGKELSGGNFSGAYCFVEKDLTETVTCNKDALSITLTKCTAKPEGDGVPLAALAGCEVFEIAWIAYAPRA
jgi:hypothetical protein